MIKPYLLLPLLLLCGGCQEPIIPKYNVGDIVILKSGEEAQIILVPKGYVPVRYLIRLHVGSRMFLDSDHRIGLQLGKQIIYEFEIERKK